MVLNPAARVRILSGGQYTMRLQSLHRAYPSLHPFGVVHWVPEQLNMKAVTGACKLIDGCSLALCSATGSVVSSGICHRNKVNSTAWLYRDGSSHKIVSFTLHYTLHWSMPPMMKDFWSTIFRGPIDFSFCGPTFLVDQQSGILNNYYRC